MSYIQQFFTSRDNNANAETFVGQEGRLWWDPITNQIYSSDGNTPGGIPLAGGGGGNGSPGGLNGQVQFNQAGNFGGTANLTINVGTGALTAVSFVGNGAALTSITGSNVVGTVGNATYAATAGSLTGNITSAGPNLVLTVDTSIWDFSDTGVLSAPGEITTPGNITGWYILGNGSQLTGIVSSYGNSNVSAYLASGTDSANITTTANISGNYILGNGSQLTGITSTYGNANVVANLAALGSNPVSTTGNVTAGYFIGNGSQLTGIVSDYGNANVVANLAALGSNPISTTGNVTAGYFIGNGSLLTNITAANISGNVANANYANTAGSTTQLVNGSSIVSLTSGGVMSFPSDSIWVANSPLTVASANTTTIQWRTPIATVAGDPFQSFMSVSNAGVLVRAISGNLSTLTANSWTFGYDGNITFPGGAVQNTAFTGTATTVTGNAQPNITSVGTLASVSVTGNVSAGNVISAGPVYLSSSALGTSEIHFSDPSETSYIIAVGNAAGTWAGNGSINLNTGNGGNIGMFVANTERGRFTSTGLAITGTASASGNVTGGNILTAGLMSATGNIKTANVVVPADGGLRANTTNNGQYYIFDHNPDPGAFKIIHIGTGQTISNSNTTINIGTQYGIANTSLFGNVIVANTLTSLSTGTISLLGNINTTANISATANVTGGNLLTGGLISATSNVTGGNLLTGGLISATGNITGGNTSALTAAVIGNVANTTTQKLRFVTSGTGIFAQVGNGVAGTTGNITFSPYLQETAAAVIDIATGNITGGNLITTGRASITGTINVTGNVNSTGILIGNGAVNNVAVGYSPAAGTKADMAIRDYSDVGSSMYFDNSVGSANTTGVFHFRGSNAFTTWAKIDQYGLNIPTRPAFRVYGGGTTNINATNTLTGNNWVVDYNQGSYLNSTTGVFTAPVAGLYQINLIARYQGNVSTSAILVRKTAAAGGTSTQVYIEWAGNSTAFHMGGATTTKMAVNDTLTLVVVSGSVTFDANDTWSVSYVG